MSSLSVCLLSRFPLLRASHFSFVCLLFAISRKLPPVEVGKQYTEWIRYGQFPRSSFGNQHLNIRRQLAQAAYIKTYRIHGQAVQAAIFRNLLEGEYIIWQKIERLYVSVFVSSGQTTLVDLPPDPEPIFIL